MNVDLDWLITDLHLTELELRWAKAPTAPSRLTRIVEAHVGSCEACAARYARAVPLRAGESVGRAAANTEPTPRPADVPVAPPATEDVPSGDGRTQRDRPPFAERFRATLRQLMRPGLVAADVRLGDSGDARPFQWRGPLSGRCTDVTVTLVLVDDRFVTLVLEVRDSVTDEPVIGVPVGVTQDHLVRADGVTDESGILRLRVDLGGRWILDRRDADEVPFRFVDLDPRPSPHCG